MSQHPRIDARITELRAIIDAYRQMTVEEAEQADAGDQEIEAQTELWRLEQERLDHAPEPRRRRAA